MYKVTVQKTVVDNVGEETLYTFTAKGSTVEEATELANIYASMVEYGLEAARLRPAEMPFPREHLYQYIQPAMLDNLVAMYPDAISVAYQSALAYVQSYIGAMFNVEEILEEGGTTSTALTLRLALIIQTAVFLLASSPQYSEATELHNQQVHTLLRGLKSGQRNFGRSAVEGDPNVRVAIVNLTKTGAKP